jgi:hypothetical protein
MTRLKLAELTSGVGHSTFSKNEHIDPDAKRRTAFALPIVAHMLAHRKHVRSRPCHRIGSRLVPGC